MTPWITRCFAIVVSVLLLPLPAFSADAAGKPWTNVSEASLVSANGNTKATTYSAKNTFNYDWGRPSLELIGGAVGSDSKGETTAEHYFASQKLSVKITDYNYTFERFAWTKDRFSGIQHRYDLSLGLGRKFLKGPRQRLIGEFGGGYVSEERTIGSREGFASGRAYTRYIRIFSPTATFSQDAEYQHNFDDRSGYRVNTETALISALSAHFSLKVGYTWRHAGRPPTGFNRNDTITSVALIASY